MATQLFPRTKAPNVNLDEVVHKTEADHNSVAGWIDNHTDENGNVKSKTSVIDTGMTGFMMNDFVDLFVTRPTAKTATLASKVTDNAITVHDFFVLSTAKTQTINQEVGTKIAMSTTLVTLSTKINQNDNGSITKITYNGSDVISANSPGDLAYVELTSKSKASDDGDYALDRDVLGIDDDEDTIPMSTSANIGGGSIEESDTINSSKALYVVPSENANGRAEITIIATNSDGSAVAKGSAVTFGTNTIYASGNTIVTGANGNKREINGTRIPTSVGETTINLSAPVSADETYRMGVGYRKYFCGYLDTYDEETIGTTLEGDGARNNVFKSGKCEAGSNKGNTGSLSKKYVYIAVPSGFKPTNCKYQDAGAPEQTAALKKVTTVNVNGANGIYPTAYDIYFVVNSNNNVIPLSFNSMFQFNIATVTV